MEPWSHSVHRSSSSLDILTGAQPKRPIKSPPPCLLPDSRSRIKYQVSQIIAYHRSMDHPYYIIRLSTSCLGSSNYLGLNVAPPSAGSPVSHTTPRGHATAPRPPHTAAQGVIGERSVGNAKLCKRAAWKGALPGTGLVGPRYGEGSYKSGNPNTNILRVSNVLTRCCTCTMIVLYCSTWVLGLSLIHI